MKCLFKKLIGKRIKTIRGFRARRVAWSQVKHPQVEPQYILFDDEKTLIKLEEQDYYTYHDCNSWARELWIKEDKEMWKRIYTNRVNYPVVTRDII